MTDDRKDLGDRNEISAILQVFPNGKLTLKLDDARLGRERAGALDQKNASEVAGLLMELNRETGVTLVVVTHSADLAARCQRRTVATSPPSPRSDQSIRMGSCQHTDGFQSIGDSPESMAAR